MRGRMSVQVKRWGWEGQIRVRGVSSRVRGVSSRVRGVSSRMREVWMILMLWVGQVLVSCV